MRARAIQTFNYIFLALARRIPKLFLNDRHARITAKAAGWACVVCARVWKILLLILIIAYKQWWCWWIFSPPSRLFIFVSMVMRTLSVPHARARVFRSFVASFLLLSRLGRCSNSNNKYKWFSRWQAEREGAWEGTLTRIAFFLLFIQFKHLLFASKNDYQKLRQWNVSHFRCHGMSAVGCWLCAAIIIIVIVFSGSHISGGVCIIIMIIARHACRHVRCIN